MRTASLVLVSAALCATAIACGGGDDTGGSSDATTTAGPTSGAGGTSTSTTSTGGASSSTTGSGGASSSASGSGGTTTTTSTGTQMMVTCSATTCDLTFNGSGFNSREGLTLKAGVVKQGVAKNALVWSDSATISGGAFSLMGTGILAKGQSYFLDYYVDVNANGACDVTPTDDVWRIPIASVQDSLVINVTYNTNFSNLGCSGL